MEIKYTIGVFIDLLEGFDTKLVDFNTKIGDVCC